MTRKQRSINVELKKISFSIVVVTLALSSFIERSEHFTYFDLMIIKVRRLTLLISLY